MKAVRFHRPKKVSVDEVPDPKLENQSDCIVRVTATAICGSDLHIYNGLIPQLRPFVLGHEFMGVVEEVGPEVKNLVRGDRVVVPFPIACGECFFCKELNVVHCERSNKKNYGPEGGLLKQKGGGLFGYTDMYGGYDGGQAEMVRVPYADFGPRKVPDQLSDEQVLFLTDIFPTGFASVTWCDPKGGESYAIFGAGPVGVMAAKAAWYKGASRVFVLDREPYRLEIAKKVANAEIIDITKGDFVEQIRAATGGRGTDIAIDAVGMEAHRGLLDKLANIFHAQMGTIDAFKSCLDVVRRGGTVSVVGVYGLPYDNFPWNQIFDKGLRLQTGQAQVHRYIDELIGAVAEGKVRLDDVITHRLPLAKADEAYAMFNEKKDNCEKVVLKP